MNDAEVDGVELLGHHRGYIWVFYYAQGKQRTHFALIHADGTPLAKSIADEIVATEKNLGASLASLIYLAPAVSIHDRHDSSAMAVYQKWLAEECGYIQLDGIPADSELSATRLRLERLFVPLRASLLTEESDDDATSEDEGDEDEEDERDGEDALPIGRLLSGTPRLAVLAMPGGGKSTFLKRLAIAYALPERRGEIPDELPDREWLPLILRCRELRDRAHRPILDLLDEIPRYAGMGSGDSGVFQGITHAALRSGTSLLLVDGLDEISDEGARRSFANNLRTFLAMFPQTALVVTSREAGFRLVAGVIASVCDQARLAPLDEEDVVELCEKWHVEVLGDSEKVRGDARGLGKSIWNNHGIRTLCENPLLLTTLLVVKRCVGELPRSRTNLYREAVRVLVRTWNVEGYAPLDEDETLAQLSFIACAMMEQGKHQIVHKDLLALLRRARRELEAELQFVEISPQEFVRRIEYRSSLLLQTGFERVDGELQAVFEFRHLTFQEYLAARGYVEEQHPGRDSGATLAGILESHFYDERWREVIPLAAVLAGRKADDLLKRLVSVYRAARSSDLLGEWPNEIGLWRLLLQCVCDEVQVTPSTIRAGLRELGRGRGDTGGGEWAILVLRGKFGTLFQEEVESAFLAGDVGFEDFVSPMERIARYLRFGESDPVASTEVSAALLLALSGTERIERVRAALCAMELAYKQRWKVDAGAPCDWFQPLTAGLGAMLTYEDVPSALAAAWALAWIGANQLMDAPPKAEWIVKLAGLWSQSRTPESARFFCWAIYSQELLSRDAIDVALWGDLDSLIRRAVELKGPGFNEAPQRHAALVLAWYRRSPWSDEELVSVAAKCLGRKDREIPRSLRSVLVDLGPAGRELVSRFEKKREGVVFRRATRPREKRLRG
ncbi:MAG: NACHT domain-containing NTPase [Candidatus Binatia bacterium]